MRIIDEITYEPDPPFATITLLAGGQVLLRHKFRIATEATWFTHGDIAIDPSRKASTTERSAPHENRQDRRTRR